MLVEVVVRLDGGSHVGLLLVSVVIYLGRRGLVMLHRPNRLVLIRVLVRVLLVSDGEWRRYLVMPQDWRRR